MNLRTLSAFLLISALFSLPVERLQATPAASPAVTVTLTAEKRVSPAGKNAQPTWQPLGQPGAAVFPSDIVRYTVTGTSKLTRPIKGFILTQPIPRGTEYVPQSASAEPAATLVTISINGGKTYVEKPTIRVVHPGGTTTDEPAPTARYTGLRWTFLQDLPALASASARCEVRVR